MRTAPLEQAQAGVGRQVAAERQLQIESPVVVAAGRLRRQKLLEELFAPGGDAVDLLGPAASLGLPPSPEGSRLAGHRTGHRDRGPQSRSLERLDRFDGPGRLEAVERRVQRAKRDARKRPKSRGQTLLEFVAVELLLFEQPQDGEFQHVSVRPIGSIYRRSV